MATIQKFYLHDATTTVVPNSPGATSLSGTTPTVAATGCDAARAMNGTIGTAQASAALTTPASTAAMANWFRRFVSAPLAAQTIGAGNWTLSGAASESNAGSNLLLWRGGIYRYRPSDGTTATLFEDVAAAGTAGTEPGTTQTAISSTWAGSAATLLAGDRLVLELWGRNAQGAATARTNTIFYDGTTEASTTNVATFLSAPAAVTLQDLPFTGTGTLTAAAATLAGSALHATPTFAGSGTLDAAGALLAGSATFAVSGGGEHPVGVLTQLHAGRPGPRYASFAGKGTVGFAAGTGALTAAGATLAGVAAHAPPTYAAAGTLTAAGATLAGSGIVATVVYQGTGALTASASTLAGVATHTPPTYAGTGALTSAPATLAGTAAHVPPTYAATGALTAASASLAGSAIVATAVYQGVGTLTAGAASLAGSATRTTPTFAGAGSLVAASSTLAGSATRTAPTYAATGALTAGAASLVGSAIVATASYQGTAALTAGAVTLVGVAVRTAPTYAAVADLIAASAALAGSGIAAAAAISQGVGALVAGPATIAGIGTVAEPEFVGHPLDSRVFASAVFSSPLIRGASS